MAVLVIKRKVNAISKKGLFKNNIMSFLFLRKEKFMEAIKRNRLKTVVGKVKRGFSKNLLIGISESSKIFYNKYFRATVHYNHLEIKKIRKRNLENSLWDGIRNQ